MNILISWLILILAIICAVGIMRILNGIKPLDSLFTGDKRHK